MQIERTQFQDKTLNSNIYNNKIFRRPHQKCVQEKKQRKIQIVLSQNKKNSFLILKFKKRKKNVVSEKVFLIRVIILDRFCQSYYFDQSTNFSVHFKLRDSDNFYSFKHIMMMAGSGNSRIIQKPARSIYRALVLDELVIYYHIQ